MRQRGERGASAVEYGILIAACAAALVVAAFAFQTVIAGSYKTSVCRPEQGNFCNYSDGHSDPRPTSGPFS